MLTENEIRELHAMFADRITKLWDRKIENIKIHNWDEVKRYEAKIDTVKSAFQKIRENQEKLFAY